MTHTVRTTHIQRLIENGLALAKAVDGKNPHQHLDVGEHRMGPHPRRYPWGVLEKAAADLRHAAEELDAERLSCDDWKQV